jgi:hypothetical protein
VVVVTEVAVAVVVVAVIVIVVVVVEKVIVIVVFQFAPFTKYYCGNQIKKMRQKRHAAPIREMRNTHKILIIQPEPDSETSCVFVNF